MNNANYMDGVPVKIAEKYKPPLPVYTLPQPLANKLNVEDNFYWNCPLFSYDFELEKKALTKIEQWKRIRQRINKQRIDRNLVKEQQRNKEYEDKQKNLLCSVSYPSTDDLSSEGEDEKADSHTELKENGLDISKVTEHKTRVEGSMNSFHNILQPTVLSGKTNTSTNNSQTLVFKSGFENKTPNSFNYKDFEDDTSSPFDNIELKTINDLDVLAQVLHNTQIIHPANENEKHTSNDSDESTKNSDRAQTTAENIPEHTSILPRFNCDFSSPQGSLTTFVDHNLVTTSSMHHNLTHSPLTPRNTYNLFNNSNGCYNYQSSHFKESTENVASISPQPCEKQQAPIDDQVKSKSVPDILRELRDEIRKAEIRRYGNCSSNVDEASQHIDPCLMNTSSVESNYVDKNQLDSKAKQLVEQVSAMGFPFKRVLRIVQLLGADDKKVVEHLIPLSELADLGFEESKISDALMRNENNKNKALDELIS